MRKPPPPPPPPRRDLLDGAMLILPAPEDAATGVTTVVSDDDDIVVMEASYSDRSRRAKSKIYEELATPAAVDDHTAPLGRTLDVGQVLSRRRRFVLGENPVVTASKHRVLSTLAIVSLCFFTVSGGPASTETNVSSGGPLLALAGYVVVPLLFNLPITLVVAELCTAFPEDGGFAMWALNAWGPFWGFLEGYWAWVRSVLDRILYVQIVYTYVFDTLGLPISSSVLRYFVRAAIAIVLTLPSLMGVRLLTFVLASILALVSLSWVVFAAWGFAKSSGTAQFGEVRLANIQFPTEATNGSISSGHGAPTLSGSWNVDVPLYLCSLFSSFDGFYLASVFGGEVSNPARTYPRAFALSFATMWFLYVVVALAAVGANSPHWSTWEDYAYIDTVAFGIGQSALHTIAIVGAIVAAAGMYLAELFCEAYQVSGMAECGLAPAVFKQRDRRFAMPRVSIAFSLVVVLLGLAFDLDAVLDVSNAFSAVVELVIVATAVKLRHTLPFVPRPTRVPGGMCLLCAVLVLPSLLLAYFVGKALVHPTSALVFAAATLVGAACGVWQRRQMHRRAGI